MPPKKKAAPKKDRRIALVITEAELAALDAWRARNHVWSRSAAIRWLVAEGIARRKA